MNFRPSRPARHLTAVRAVLVFTVLCGLLYPMTVTAIAQLPGLRGKADGSLLRTDGKVVGSALIGQAFTDRNGNPLVQYFQTRPSAAAYDAMNSGAANLGPESVVDTLARNPADTTLSLLSTVCRRSYLVGQFEHVDGRRPYCTADGLGAVLGVYHREGLTGRITRVVSLNQACPSTPFLRTYGGVRVECARPGTDYAAAVVTPIRGNAPAHTVVPPDAVTASGSGLDPDISVAYARLQAARVARARGIPVPAILALVARFTTGRVLGFIGEPAVDVVPLNKALDDEHPYTGQN
jgi:K+-transporting ATPase ATPase C chain